jgi:hypothetical protein
MDEQMEENARLVYGMLECVAWQSARKIENQICEWWERQCWLDKKNESINEQALGGIE